MAPSGGGAHQWDGRGLSLRTRAWACRCRRGLGSAEQSAGTAAGNGFVDEAAAEEGKLGDGRGARRLAEKAARTAVVDIVARGRGRAGERAADEATGRPRGSSPPWTSLRGRPRAMASLRKLPGGGEAGGRRRE